MLTNTTLSVMEKLQNSDGRIGPPVLLWLLGVPGGICFLLWVFFFRG